MEYDKELEKIIESIVDNPRELYVKIYCSLSPSEKEKFKELVQNKTCINCTNHSCRIESSDKNNEITSCFGWENPEYVGKQRVLVKNKLRKC